MPYFCVMADVHSKETRSYNMSRIRSKDTKPEMLVRSFLSVIGQRATNAMTYRDSSQRSIKVFRRHSFILQTALYHVVARNEAISAHAHQ
jgi:hypothetical protein